MLGEFLGGLLRVEVQRFWSAAATRVGPAGEERRRRRAAEAGQVLRPFPAAESVGLYGRCIAELRLHRGGDTIYSPIMAAATDLLDDICGREQREWLETGLSFFELFDFCHEYGDLSLDHVDLDFFLREQLVALGELFFEFELHVEKRLALEGEPLDVGLEVEHFVGLVVRLDDSGQRGLLAHVLALYLQLIDLASLRLREFFFLVEQRFEQLCFSGLL